MKRFLIVALAFLIPLSASATRIRRLTLEEVRNQARTIFSGRVLSSSTRSVTVGQRVFPVTDYTIEVAEIFHGDIAGTTTTVTYFGAKGPSIVGAPVLESGRTYIFFRSGQPNNTTIGWGQGLYRVETVTTGGVTKTLLVSGDGETLTVRQGRLERGPAIMIRNGEIVTNAVSESQSEPKSTGVAVNADGTRARRVAPVSPAAAIQQPTYATVDDLRAFVRAKASAEQQQ